jgi:hypothetical protein
MSDQKKLTLCVFIDALGWEVLQRHPFLDDILAVKAPLNTIFGYSSTCDPTILTASFAGAWSTLRFCLRPEELAVQELSVFQPASQVDHAARPGAG